MYSSVCVYVFDCLFVCVHACVGLFGSKLIYVLLCDCVFVSVFGCVFVG